MARPVRPVEVVAGRENPPQAGRRPERRRRNHRLESDSVLPPVGVAAGGLQVVSRRAHGCSGQVPRRLLPAACRPGSRVRARRPARRAESRRDRAPTHRRDKPDRVPGSRRVAGEGPANVPIEPPPDGGTDRSPAGSGLPRRPVHLRLARRQVSRGARCGRGAWPRTPRAR